MKRYMTWCGVVLLLATPLHAQQQTAGPKIVLDVWDAAYLDGAKAGHQHTTVEQIERDGRTLFHTTQLVHLTLKRYNGIITVRWAATSDETTDGKVVGLSWTQYLDKDRKMVYSGLVQDDKLIVRTPSDPDGKTVPWHEGVLGYYNQEVMFQKRKVKVGDRFRFFDYQLPIRSAVEQQVTVKDKEERTVLEAAKDEESKAVWTKRKLLRAEIQPGKIMIGNTAVPLPLLIVWLDDKMQRVRSESEIPALGRITLYRTSRAVAEKEGAAPALMTDFGLKTIVPLSRVIERPHEAEEIVYRITVKEDDDAKTTFARDARQKVENVHGNTFDLRVRPIRQPSQGENAAQAKEEYLKSSYFLDSDDAQIRAQAARIVGDEKSPWRRAQRIERWVHENMRGSNDLNLTPASAVLRDLRGDCRQHAMLTAALCRAVGIPSRTAVGLVYADEGGRHPMFAFHMWTEVWIKGQWLMLDAVLGKGSVGAGHLKIADLSWQDIQTLAPLLPVLRVIGKVRIEVVEVK
jgi:hypothetical protein